MKVKRLFGTLSIAALAGIALVGCGYDQNTGGIGEQATITDADYAYVKSTVWGFGSKKIYDSDVDLASGYSLFANNKSGTQLTFADIDGVRSIKYTYYKKTNYSISDIYAQSKSTYTDASTLWDDDKIHVNSDNIGTEQASTNIKDYGTYLFVLSFEVNEKRYKPIQDLVTEVTICKKAVINEDNFTFNSVTVTKDNASDITTAYAKVTLGNEVIDLKPTGLMEDEDLAKLGLSGVSYKYTNLNNDTELGTVPSQPGSYRKIITLIPATNYETPLTNGQADITVNIQDTASSKTVNYVVNNNEVADVTPKTTTASVLNADLMPELSCDGYDFDGWYIDAALTTPATIATAVTNGMKLYAKWIQTKFNVDYVENLVGVTAVTDLTKVNKLPDTLPTIQDTTDYAFGGWYTNKACTEAAEPGAAITANTTLYAKWTKKASLETGVLIDEKFDVINPESLPNVTVSNADITNTAGAAVITANSTSNATLDFDFGIALPEEGSKTSVAISFDLTQAQNASSWASFVLYDGTTAILDNNGGANNGGVFATRFGGQAANTIVTTYEKVAATKYSYTIGLDVLHDGTTTVNVSVSDGTNDYTLVTNKQVTISEISKLRFGNTSNAQRVVTVDNVRVYNVTVSA